MFISRFADLSHVYASAYDGVILGLAAITAITASWIALGVSRRLHDSRTGKRWLWLAWWMTGSLILGLAIWGMHFVAVLAMRLPIAFSFDPATTAVSVVPAVLAGALVLRAAKIDPARLGLQLLLAGGLAAGILLMQYIGMNAMRMRADILYDPAWFTLSLVAAFTLSWAVLRIKWMIEKRGARSALSMLVPSVLMGVALMGIHSTTMLGTYFFPNENAPPAAFQSIMAPETLAWLIAASVLLMALLLATAVRLSHRIELANLVERSAEFQRSLLDASNEGIVTTDSTGTITSLNGTAERMFGRKASQTVGQNVMVLLPEDIRRKQKFFMSGDELNLPRIVNRTLELKIDRNHGGSLDIELTVTPLQKHGRLELIGVVRDISRRKQAERQLRDQKANLEFLLAASPIVIYTRKASGCMPFTFVSPNIQELFGYLASDIRAASSFWSEKIHPDDVDRVMSARKDLRESGMTYVEYRLEYPDGRYRWVSDRQLLTRNAAGKPDIVIGNWADVHARKEDEIQLRSNEERMRISMECAQLATWDWIIESGKVVWSSNMREKLGLEPEAPATFESFMSCVHPEDRGQIKAAFKRSLVMGTHFDEEYRIVWPDKGVRWLHAIGGLVCDSDGNPQQMVGILYDVTEQKKLRLAPQAIKETA